MTLISKLEAASYDTWTPDHSTEIGGWNLYATDGFTRRINCASGVGEPSVEPEVWASASNWLVERGALPIVRVTPLLDRSVVDVFRSRGYEEIDDSVVLTAAAQGSYDDHIRLVDVADNGFFGDINALNDRRDTSIPAWQRLLQRVRLRAAGIWVPGVAAGLVVVSGRYAGVFSVAVAPDHRRQGLATRMMDAAGAWALDRGADTMFLQVFGENTAALGLYEQLGYTEQYRYSYLQPVGDSPDAVIDGC